MSEGYSMNGFSGATTSLGTVDDTSSLGRRRKNDRTDPALEACPNSLPQELLESGDRVNALSGALGSVCLLSSAGRSRLWGSPTERD